MNFNLELKNFQPIDYDRTRAAPENCVIVEFPRPEYIDSYGYAKYHDMDVEKVVRQIPIVLEHKAVTVPWELTPWAKIFQHNSNNVIDKKNVSDNYLRKRMKGL